MKILEKLAYSYVICTIMATILSVVVCLQSGSYDGLAILAFIVVWTALMLGPVMLCLSSFRAIADWLRHPQKIAETAIIETDVKKGTITMKEEV